MSIIMPNHTANQIERSIVIVTIIKDIRKIFRLVQKKVNGIKDRVTRVIRKYNQYKLLMPLMVIILKMKVMEIKTKHYQLNNILIKLHHI